MQLIETATCTCNNVGEPSNQDIEMRRPLVIRREPVLSSFLESNVPGIYTPVEFWES